MRKNIETLKKQILDKQIILITVLLNLAVYVAYWAMYSVRLLTTADKILDISFREGNVAREVVAMWMKTVPNFVMQIAYSILPNLSWYVLFQQGCVLLALCLVTYVLLKDGVNWSSCVISIIFVAFIGYDGYVQISYIKTAILCCAVAYFILHKRIKGNKIYTLFLMLMAYFWCGEIALAVGLLMVLSLVIKQVKCDKKIFVLFLCVLSAVLIFEGIHLVYSQQHENKNDMVEFYEVWTAIEENGWPNYIENERIFEDLDISEEDYLLIQSVYTVDNEIVSITKLQKILKLTDEKKIDIDGLVRYGRTYPVSFVFLRVFYGFMMILFFFGISETDRKKEKMLGVCIGVPLLLVLAYILGVGYNAGVVRGILISGITLLVGLLGKLEIPSKEWKYYYTFSMMVFLLISMVHGT